MSFYAEYKAIMPKKVLTSWPLVNMLDCEYIFNWPLWEYLYQGLMDGFLDVSKALWKGLYSRRDCIRQHINFPAVLWPWLKTKDARFTLWPDVAFSTIGESIYRWPLLFSRFLQKTYGQPISQISVVFVYVPNFCMARQEVKPTLKFGFQVYRHFVC